MNHEKYREWVQLSLHDELAAEERKMLTRHLETCNECRDDVAKLQKLNSLVKQNKSWEPDDELLREARMELRAALRLEQRRKQDGNSLVEFLSNLFNPKLVIAFGGAAMLAIGMTLGYFVLPGNDKPGMTISTQLAENASFDQGEAKITNVHFIGGRQEGSDVEFTFDAITPVHIRGNVNDDRVQKVLTHALLNEDNPGVRLRSVNAIASQAEQPRPMQDQSIKNALLKALKSDENPAVRKEALKALSKFSLDDDVKRVFLSVLIHDNNSGIRIAVINILDSARVEGKQFDQDVLDVLKQRMKSDDNNYIRIRAKAALEEIKQ